MVLEVGMGLPVPQRHLVKPLLWLEPDRGDAGRAEDHLTSNKEQVQGRQACCSLMFLPALWA